MYTRLIICDANGVHDCWQKFIDYVGDNVFEMTDDTLVQHLFDVYRSVLTEYDAVQIPSTIEDFMTNDDDNWYLEFATETGYNKFMLKWS
jgi:hypothetical protein